MDAPSQFPEAVPNCCPACGSQVAIEQSTPVGDFPCPQCGSPLWFLRTSLGEVVVLTFLPRSARDRETVERVDDVISAVGNLRRVVLNLSHLPFVSAFFLGMLVRLHLKMEAAQATLKACGLSRESEEVFKVTRLDSIFDICPDEQTAINSF